MDIGERAGQLDTSDTSDTETRSADADAVTTVLAALAWLRQRTGWSKRPNPVRAPARGTTA